MDRTTIVVGIVSLACAACGGAIAPGLANVQPLGGSSAVDVRPMDVVANGNDACGRGGEGSVLRGKYPSCPNQEKTRADFGFASAPPKVTTPLRIPWNRSRSWPCLENPELAVAKTATQLEIVPASCSFTR
jgi:hypothetical protein